MLLVPVGGKTLLDLHKQLENSEKGFSIEIYTLEEKERSTKARERRSISANNYMWLLCSMLADELTKRGVRMTKEEVYRKNIRETFTPNNPNDNKDNPISYSDHFRSDLVKDIIAEWESRGVGWICEEDGPAAVYGRTYLNFW